MNSNPLIVAQFGCGYWAPNLLRTFSTLSGCEVRYVIDSSPERRTFVDTNFPRTLTVDSIDIALNDPEVAAVGIPTPAATHFGLAKSSGGRGASWGTNSPSPISRMPAASFRFSNGRGPSAPMVTMNHE
jgi:hypothetical protein